MTQRRPGPSTRPAPVDPADPFAGELGTASPLAAALTGARPLAEVEAAAAAAGLHAPLAPAPALPAAVAAAHLLTDADLVRIGTDLAPRWCPTRWSGCSAATPSAGRRPRASPPSAGARCSRWTATRPCSSTAGSATTP
ncbi:MAG: hypothetical protein R3F59_04105 [Myxococcota bacterium]